MVFDRLLLTVASLIAATAVSAQSLPKDSNIREGHLDNGLTYYILHNNRVEGQADFYLAHRVGSILEENDQRGLAHFLEHMAFNGTKHFPDGNAGPRSIRSWCEKNGIKFGTDLNASTSIERTIFNVSNVPVNKPGVVDTCLLILSDWSGSILLRDDEIDNERGVIHEEWRTRRSSMAVQRLMEDAMATIYKGSKYADCLPIGSMDVVDNFRHDVLRRFYSKWYRPDLQAVVVVGDVDVDQVEAKIRSLFSAFPMPSDATIRPYYPVPDNDRMIVYTKTDNEQPTLYMQLFIKRDALPRGQRSTRQAFADDYKSRLALFVVRQRLAELLAVPQPCMISCTARDGGFYLTSEKDAFTISIGLKPDDPKAGIDAAMDVIEKLRLYGITEAELDHAKLQHNVNLEHRVDNKDRTYNHEYVAKIINHFSGDAHLMSIEQEADIEHDLMDSVTIDDVNATLRDIIPDGSSEKNQVLVVYGPTQWNDKPYDIPAADSLTSWILGAQNRYYVDDNVNTPVDRKFMKNLPLPGSIVERTDFGNGYTRYLLSNGINVYARPSDIEPNRLTLKMFRGGGRALYADSDVLSMNMLSNVITHSGADDFNHLILEKKRAGKALRVTPFFNEDEEGFNGVCAASDFKTWLEVAYLYSTCPRKDADMFSSLKERNRMLLVNRDASPRVVFNDTLRQVIYVNPHRNLPLTVDNIDNVSHDRIMDIYSERFSNLSGMSLIVTGDIRTDEFEELICQYVASLPGNPDKPLATVGPGDNYLQLKQGNTTKVFDYKQETPSAFTEIVYSAPLPYTADNDLRADVLSQILRTIYTDTVREKLGATYGVSVNSQGWSTPESGFSLTISFRCDPERYQDIAPVVDEQIQLIAEQGPTQEQLQNVKEYERKYYERVVASNGWWEYVCYNKIANGVDFNEGYLARVDALTAADIQSFCRQILASGNRAQVTMK